MNSTSYLRETLKRLERTIITFLPARYANLLQMSKKRLWNVYFREAEKRIDEQWQTFIWPEISDFDFSNVVELAAGAGRNTVKLAEHSKRIHAIDYQEYAIKQAESRLGNRVDTCVIQYSVNDGSNIEMVPTDSSTTVYCWDSAVHFERSILENYIKEFARVLKKGGKGFLHHSDLGDGADKNIKNNPHWRSNVDSAFVRQTCVDNGLTILKQKHIPWGDTGNINDCITIFEK